LLRSFELLLLPSHMLERYEPCKVCKAAMFI